MKIKVVAITNIWESKGPSREFPMWTPVGSREYIIGRVDHEPTLHEIGEMVQKLQHLLEGKVAETVIEVFSGYEVYEAHSLTHNEGFQLQLGDAIDYPAEDITDKLNVEQTTP
jgi:hypothetical protein|tara:strand:+ start:32 stop:370 length:339 start_codon:yes stop_codon:yes gene_type:complete